MTLGSVSLAVKLSLVSVTACSGVSLSAKALKAVMKLGSLSLAMKLSLVSVTTCSDVNLSAKALKASVKLGSLSLAVKISLVSVTACSGVSLSTGAGLGAAADNAGLDPYSQHRVADVDGLPQILALLVGADHRAIADDVWLDDFGVASHRKR